MLGGVGGAQYQGEGIGGGGEGWAWAGNIDGRDARRGSTYLGS